MMWSSGSFPCHRSADIEDLAFGDGALNRNTVGHLEPRYIACGRYMAGDPTDSSCSPDHFGFLAPLAPRDRGALGDSGCRLNELPNGLHAAFSYSFLQSSFLQENR